jgi:eukaryotic-like serine/threonine-protein kinase
MLLEVDASGAAAGAPGPLVATPFQETNAVVSADGTRLAYESDELDGVFQVYVRSFPEGGTPIRVSSSGGRRPRWGADGRLYYWASGDQRLEAVRVEPKHGRLAADAPQPVIEAQAGVALRQPRP